MHDSPHEFQTVTADLLLRDWPDQFQLTSLDERIIDNG